MAAATLSRSTFKVPSSLAAAKILANFDENKPAEK